MFTWIHPRFNSSDRSKAEKHRTETQTGRGRQFKHHHNNKTTRNTDLRVIAVTDI